ncbi:hypothetical protein LNV23_23575 [Paucibacter sp. DJ1R-11]|uniref:hypothetical protein n=1 Tax=Paucibacter sp. DJ1R-11 TaxID=2893556 RepID=UPI0021E41E9D|nr:hypothetical protein [Paucibacter sp. DJ1R-11]MCV2366421.1 hypothetical protein [Paucibacter sp. DJ1R-11]
MTLNQNTKPALNKEAAPEHSQPMLEAHRARIEREVKDIYRASTHLSQKTHATQATIIKLTVRIYSDLHSLGYAGLSVGNLKPVHLAALLGLWRNGVKSADGNVLRQPVARSTAGNMWSVLRGWCALLGKNGMAREFQYVWPDDQPALKKVRTAREKDAVYSRQCLVHTISEPVYQSMIASWHDVPSRKLIYWVVRATRELKIDVQTALQLEPEVNSKRKEGYLVVKGWKGADVTAVPIDTDEKRALVEGLISYTKTLGIKRLCWDKEDCPTIDIAARRVTNAVRYQVSKLVLAEDA